MNQIKIDPNAAHTQTIIVEVVGAIGDHFPSSDSIFILGGAWHLTYTKVEYMRKRVFLIVYIERKIDLMVYSLIFKMKVFSIHKTNCFIVLFPRVS